MYTKKPIATISYNSEYYLVGVLNALIKERKIDTWAYIRHYAEEDEKKDHIHLYIEPSKAIDTGLLITDFIEPTEDLPLGVMPFRSSKWQDWFLYTSHNIEYLSSKGEFRKYHYTKDMFVYSNEEYFFESIRLMNTGALTAQNRFFNAIADGLTFADILHMGIVPLNSVISYQKAYEILVKKIAQNY